MIQSANEFLDRSAKKFMDQSAENSMDQLAPSPTYASVVSGYNARKSPRTISAPDETQVSYLFHDYLLIPKLIGSSFSSNNSVKIFRLSV